MFRRTCHLFTSQEVLHQLHFLATDESVGEDSELDCEGGNFEEAGDGYCSGNEQLTGGDFIDSSGR